MSGKERLFKNVIWSWLGHLAFIIAGFILPRAINDNVGQVLLGIWDFAWSIVNYLTLVQMGIGTSVNRYVAKYAALNDFKGLNTSVISVFVIQMLLGAVIIILTFILYYIVPIVWEEKLGEHLDEAQTIIIILGFSTALRTAFGAYDGVITGMHRWDLYNINNSLTHILTITIMVIALYKGGDLVTMSYIYLLGSIATILIRIIIANKVCRHLDIRIHYFKIRSALEMIRFGGKNFLTSVSQLFLYQTNGILIVSLLGPQLLAIFMRPLALVQHLKVFVGKLGNTLTPVITEIHVKENKQELVSLVLNSTKYTISIALPGVLFLVIMGEPLMEIWMGADYVVNAILVLLPLGHLLTIAHLPLVNCLVALNEHGKIALANIIAAVSSVLLSYIYLKYTDLGIIGVAIAISVPLSITDGLVLPYIVLRKLDVKFLKYVNKTWKLPIIINMFVAMILVISSTIDNTVLSLLIAALVSGLVILAAYWKWIFPENIKHKLTRRFV
ncbi:MAG: oligosaccharide flippase family protein [Candidatus Thiodiazotropha sp. (ex Monitilora ramsayi)]|nr:oligosaccharide flippase family protein [Candidatus Thiodiazotropha sp. (ex Monitilora ramsayi)]